MKAKSPLPLREMVDVGHYLVYVEPLSSTNLWDAYECGGIKKISGELLGILMDCSRYFPVLYMTMSQIDRSVDSSSDAEEVAEKCVQEKRVQKKRV